MIVVLSGGPFDEMNPREVRDRMDQLAAYSGLPFNLLPGQSTPHIHQAKWRQVCAALGDASPLVLVGHSNGGAAAMNVARELETQGTTVDLLITCDSVFTVDDSGGAYTVPANVALNLNSYTVETKAWWWFPFPHGRRNARADGGQAGILNVGMAYPLPGMLAHRNAFYDLTGGDSFGYPRLLLDLVRSALVGVSYDEMVRVALACLQVLATGARVPITVDTATERVELR